MPQWTPQQHSAIHEVTGDLLVSASAGTGKTAVLVERILQLLTREDAPVALDRFLVVTFTEAAAAEMREKIAVQVRRRLGETPSDFRLRRQLLLLENAQISTIHAFCLALVRRHFHRLALDPEMSVLDEQEALLLRTEVLAQVFEDEGALDRLEAFTSLNGPAFYRLPPNADRIRLTHRDTPVSLPAQIAAGDDVVTVFDPGFPLYWHQEHAQ